MAFVSNIKVGDTTNGVRAVAIPSGQVDSTSTSTAFTATIPGITELKNGVCVFLKNGVVTSASGCTLNINGLGAKPIYNTMAAATAVTTTFNSGYTMLFVYDETRVSGGCWMMYYGYNSSGYTSNVAQGQCYGTCSTAVGTAAKTVSMSSYALVAHGICAIKFTNGNTAANPTLNINSKGAKAIYWNGAACPTNLIKANDVVIMMYNTQYHIVGIYNGNRGFATTTPIMDGTGAIGSSTEYARADHVHPTDTSRAPVESPAFTGTPTAPTPTDSSGDIIPNIGWVNNQISNAFINYEAKLVEFIKATLYPFSLSINDTFTVVNFISQNRMSYGQLVSSCLEGAQTYTVGVLVDDSQANEIIDSFPILPIGMSGTNISFQGIYKNKLITFLVTQPEDSEYCIATITDIYEIGATTGAMHFKGRALQTLTDGGTENAASSSGSPYTGEAGDVYLQSGTDTNEEYVWVKLGDAAGYWEKLGRDDLPTASTTTAGIVTLADWNEYEDGTAELGNKVITDTFLGNYSEEIFNTFVGAFSPINHTHGNITSDGAVTTSVTVASRDCILITDNSDNSKVKGGPIFNTASATYFLNAEGRWIIPAGDHKVTQAPVIINDNCPILLGGNIAATTTAIVSKTSTLVYNPFTRKLLVDSATVATVADIPTWTVS